MQKSISRKFLETAQSDLSAARLLHQNEAFPHAIFSLQQSIEKTIKAVGLQVGLISFDGDAVNFRSFTGNPFHGTIRV